MILAIFVEISKLRLASVRVHIIRLRWCCIPVHLCSETNWSSLMISQMKKSLILRVRSPTNSKKTTLTSVSRKWMTIISLSIHSRWVREPTHRKYSNHSKTSSRVLFPNSTCPSHPCNNKYPNPQKLSPHPIASSNNHHLSTPYKILLTNNHWTSKTTPYPNLTNSPPS